MTHLWNKISQRDCEKSAIIQRQLTFRNEFSLICRIQF